jgi:hypothetical protein
MKLAFPTAPTAPAAEEREQTRKQQTGYLGSLRKTVLDVLG